jgi:predicted nucleic acid-binding protein
LSLFLLDTSVVSALAPKKAGDVSVDEETIGWLRRNERDCQISAMTIVEIESGIQQLVLSGSTRRGPELSGWLAGLLQTFARRLVAIDTTIARAAGRLEALALASGRHPGLPDIIIAATGEVKGLTVLTRNLRHFLPLKVAAIDPFKTRLPG